VDFQYFLKPQKLPKKLILPVEKGLTRFSDSRIRRSTRLLQKPIDQEMDSKICGFKMLEKFWNTFLFFYKPWDDFFIFGKYY